MVNLTPQVISRFEAKVIPEALSGCWLWTAGSAHFGYGAFSIEGTQYKAHRIAWLLAGNSIPPDMCVLHKCDTPQCVNPDHLFLGSSTDNMADMVQKGRSLKGDRNPSHLHPETRPRWDFMKGRNHAIRERNGNAKLTTDIIHKIRRCYQGGSVSQSEVAKLYSTSQSHVSRIVLGRTRWTDHAPSQEKD